MSWSSEVYATRLQDSDFSGAVPGVYQPFSPPRDVRVKAIRTPFVFYNSPSFTSLGLRIYTDISDSDSTPAQLLKSFDKTWTLAEIMTEGLAYGVQEIYFDVTNPFRLKGGTNYHLVPWVSGAALTSGSHISWVKGFPDPNTTPTETVTLAKIAKLPHSFAIIGAD